MKYYQEQIDVDSDIPARIYISNKKEGKSHYPLHWHSSLEFDLVLKGKIHVRMNGQQMVIKEGDFFFANSSELHETDASEAEDLSTITILLSYVLLKEYYKEIDSYYFDFDGKEEAKLQVKELILECAKVYEEKEEFYELLLSILLRKLCHILLTQCKKKREVTRYQSYDEKNLEHMKKAIAYMEHNYENQLSLQHISNVIGMSPTYFSRFFKQTTGENFYSYLNKIRLYHANKALLNSDETITEIALNHGFANVKSFIEGFKKVYHITPAKYRSQMTNKG